jgi:hypothetical protein
MAKITDKDWESFKEDLARDGLSTEGSIALPNDEDSTRAVELARLHLIEQAPYAAAQIAQLSKHASNERVRLDASKFIVERVLGPAGQPTQGAKSPLEMVMSGFIKEVEQHANGEASPNGEGA